MHLDMEIVQKYLNASNNINIIDILKLLIKT